MKKMYLIFRNTMRHSRLIILIAFLGGLALCLLFNMMKNVTGSYYGGIPIGFIVHEETVVTADFRSYLTEDLGMEVTESEDIDLLNADLVERKISAIVEIPKGFETALLGGDSTALLVSFLDDYANAAFIQAYLENYTSSVSVLALGANGDSAVLEMLLRQSNEYDIPIYTQTGSDTVIMEVTEKNALRQSLGFYLMYGFLLTTSVAQQLFDERQKGLYKRIKTSSVRSLEYTCGVCLMGVICSLFLIMPLFIYIQISGFAIGMEIWQAILLCFVYALFVIGIALVFALYLETKSAIIVGIVGLSTITCLLGGAFFPISFSPVFMQRFARITPQFWFIDAVEKLQENNGGSFGINVLIIGLFALLCYILAGVRFVDSGKKRSKITV